MPEIIRMEGITKHFPGVLANDRVDFSIDAAQTHALVGENGAGKSTLMKILYGQYAPDEGKIFVNGTEQRYGIVEARGLGIGMVYQNFMQIPQMSIFENIILGDTPSRYGFVARKRAREKAKYFLDRFNMKCNMDKPIDILSVGERQKIEIIKTLYSGATVLILDEPTAVLTPQESLELFKFIDQLKAEGKSIVFISHKLREVIAVADRITIMRKGRVVAASLAGGSVSEADIARAMIGKQDVQLIQNRQGCVGDETLLEAKNLWYFNGDGIAKLKSVSLSVKSGEILGIGGVEGNGQTELIDVLTGMIKPDEGELRLLNVDITGMNVHERREAGIGFVSEDRMTTGLALDAGLEENLICGKEHTEQFSRHGILMKKKIDEYGKEMTQLFDIRGLAQGKPVKALSGGNMQKVVLARELSRNPRALIAAQPTRGLDVGAINFVRERLLEQKQSGTGILLVSADLEELTALSDRMIIMYEGMCFGEILDVKNTSEEDIGLLMGGVTLEGRQA